ncbi:MAG: 16S rRNA (guanine(527)-N(7))-methyltransferase RsmG [Bacilli bacterium]|nr:16S rRNA (guanine(527)-N(7))-methyltransferase RsmG [Bacilli bacterium]
MILNEFNLNEKQNKQFALYLDFLISENKKYNLTSIVEKDEIYIKHFYDSLKLKDAIDLEKVSSFLDIGSGAGFPAIPIKILFPHLLVTIIEPTLKRCNFLNELVKLLELENIEIINERAENITFIQREAFDIVTARAVANLNILLELTIPYVKVGGHFLALKGTSYEEEISGAKSAFKILNCEVVDIYKYDLPMDLGKRVIIDFLKNKKTKSLYPRKYALIKKKQL